MSEIRIIGPDGQRFVFPSGTDPEVMKAAMRRRYTGETRRGREMILEGQLPDQSLTAAQQYLAKDQLQRDLEAGRAAAATEAATGPEDIARERFYTGAQGVTLGAAPLIQGAVNVPLAALMFPFLTEEQRAGRDLGQFVADMSGSGYAQARGSIERAREKRPLESAGIEIAGGFLTGKTVYDELGRRFLANQTGARGALVGAGATGQYEFLESEGDPAAAARGALIGAPVGAGVSKALEATAEPLGRMFRGEVPVPPEATNTLFGAGIGAAGPAETPEERARNIVVGAGLGYGGTRLGAMGRRTVGVEPTTPAGPGGYFNRQSMRLPGVGPSAREAELAETWRETTPIIQTARTAATSGEQAAATAVQSRAPGDIARAKDAKTALIREIETAQAARAGMDTPEDARLADALEALKENTSDPLLISSQIGAAKTSLERLLTDLGRPTMPSTMGRAPLRPPLRRTFSAEEEARLAPETPEPPSRTRYAEGEVPPVKGMGFGVSSQTRTPAPPFYSALERALTSTKMARAPGQQWKATLKNMPGVKEEEIEFTGLNDWLDLQTGPVSREDVANYVRNNGVKVEEVVKTSGEAANQEIRLKLIETKNFFERQEIVDWYEDDYDMKLSGNLNAWREMAEMLDDSKTKDRIDELEEAYNDYKEFQDTDFDEGEWGMREEQTNRALSRKVQFAVDRLEDRRSTLIDAAETKINDLDTGVEGATKWSAHTLPGGEEYTEVLFTLPAKTGEKEYTSDHWNEKNVLAHVRFKDRQSPNGQRVLALEEIQSDWHQMWRALKQYQKLGGAAGRDAAFAKIKDLIYKEWPTISQTIKGIKQEGQNLPNVTAVLADLGGQRLASYSSDLLDAFEKHKKFIKLSKLFEKNKDVPDGPFKQTSSWTSLVLNRMIRKAADEGYDGIAWIPGDIQNGKRISASDDNRSDFYDKIVVNAANEIGKKYGARVEKMPGLAVDQNGKPVDFYYLALTPDMKAKAQQEGFPLFAAAPFAAVGGVGAGMTTDED